MRKTLMSGTEYLNGNRPTGLLHLLDPSLNLASRPKNEDVNFELVNTLNSIVRLTSNITEDSLSAKTLGTEREGSAILINNDRLLLTIGYLVLDADAIHLKPYDNEQTSAEIISYHHETGLALLRAQTDLTIKPISIGGSNNIQAGDKLIVASYGGLNYSINVSIASRQEFSGSWEYMLDDAIFAVPTHPNWSGAALIDIEGNLCGVGSLWINDNEKYLTDTNGEKTYRGPGNMFVPIDAFTPIYDELISTGTVYNKQRPWLGMYTAESLDKLIVSGIIPNAPADMAGVKQGDLIETVNGEKVDSLSEMYKILWSLGSAGTRVILGVDRDGENIQITVTSDSRYNFMKTNKKH